MSSLLAWLVEPPVSAPAPRPTPAAAPAASAAVELALLAPPGDAASLAATIALRVTRGTAVVGLWPGARTPSLVSTPGARRLAASLSARDLPASASGRLVTVALEDAAAAARLRGAVGAVPLVLAVAGPRDAAWDRLLTGCDLVLVHAREPAVADLAVSRLAEQGAGAARLDTPPGAAARTFARAGLALPGGLAALSPELFAVTR